MTNPNIDVSYHNSTYERTPDLLEQIELALASALSDTYFRTQQDIVPYTVEPTAKPTTDEAIEKAAKAEKEHQDALAAARSRIGHLTGHRAIILAKSSEIEP